MEEKDRDSRYLDEIYKRLRILKKFVLVHIILLLVTFVLFYVISVFALLEIEFAENVLTFVTNKLPVISVISLGSLIVSALYYAAILDFGRFEFGFIKASIIGFVYFLFSMLSPSSADANAAESVLIKTCIFGLFLYLMFFWAYCDAMKRLSKKILKCSSECWVELKRSANVITALSAIICGAFLIVVKVLNYFTEFDASQYGYYSDSMWEAYDRYLDDVSRRTNAIAIFLMIGLGILVVASVILKFYEYNCIKKTLKEDEEYDAYFDGV